MTMGDYTQLKANQTKIESNGIANFSKWVKIPNTLFRIHYSDETGRVYMTLNDKLDFNLSDKIKAMTKSPTLDYFKNNWVEISNEKNYKVDYKGRTGYFKTTPNSSFEYPNWGGLTVCIKGKDEQGKAT